MNTAWFDSEIRQIACASISGYQKYISPSKGFSCAHRLLYGGVSCSEYVKSAIAQRGLAAAIEASRQRFHACREANQILKASMANSESEDEAKPKKRKRNDIQNQDNCLANFDPVCYECTGENLNCASILPSDIPSCELPDCSHCGSGIDCQGVDCGSGLDCGGADCGSCGS